MIARGGLTRDLRGLDHVAAGYGMQTLASMQLSVQLDMPSQHATPSGVHVSLLGQVGVPPGVSWHSWVQTAASPHERAPPGQMQAVPEGQSAAWPQ